MPISYTNYKPYSDPYLIYGAHIYIPHEFTHQGLGAYKLGAKYPGIINFRYWDENTLKNALKPIIEFQNTYHKLIFVGEFSAVRWGDGADLYLQDLIDIFDNHQWGWAYFGYNEYHGWNPDYDNIYSTNDPQDWKQHYIGKNSKRWDILNQAFKKSKVSK